MLAAKLAGSAGRSQPRRLGGTAFLLAIACMAGLLIVGLLPRNPAPVAIDAFTVTPSLGGSGMSAGYGAIRNGGEKTDRLLEVKLEGADRVELHDTVREGAMATMRRITLPLDLAPGEELRFEPLQRHLMIFAQPHTFSLGDTGAMTFVFERTGSVTARFKISYPPST